MAWVRHLLLMAMLIIIPLTMVIIAIHHEKPKHYKQQTMNLKYKVYILKHTIIL